MKRPNPARRNFLRTGLAAAAASSCPTGLFAREPALNTRIAVKYRMIEENLGATDKFKLLQELGFDGVEVYTRDVADRAAYRKAREITGLPIHGVINSSDPDITTAVEMADYVGGNAVLVLAREDPKKSYDENVAHWQELIRKAIPVAEKHGVRLLIENVRATFLKTAEGMARFIDSFETPLVGSYFDIGNTITWTEQPPEHWARVLGKRIGKLDIKDRGHPEFGDEKLAVKGLVGTDGGEVNWKAVREELANLHFDGWATAEVAGGDRQRLAGIAAWMNQVLRRG